MVFFMNSGKNVALAKNAGSGSSEEVQRDSFSNKIASILDKSQCIPTY